MVAISADSLESHRRFAEQEGGFPFPLASDEELVVTNLYNVLSDDSRRSRRAVFVIDQDGSIIHAIPYYNPANLDQFQQIFQALGIR